MIMTKLPESLLGGITVDALDGALFAEFAGLKWHAPTAGDITVFRTDETWAPCMIEEVLKFDKGITFKLWPWCKDDGRFDTPPVLNVREHRVRGIPGTTYRATATEFQCFAVNQEVPGIDPEEALWRFDLMSREDGFWDNGKHGDGTGAATLEIKDEDSNVLARQQGSEVLLVEEMGRLLALDGKARAIVELIDQEDGWGEHPTDTLATIRRDLDALATRKK